MEVTEVRVQHRESQGSQSVAYLSVCLDGELVVHGVKVLDRPEGPLLDFPADKVRARCRACTRRVLVEAAYCERCGVPGPCRDAPAPARRRYSSVCHPANPESRARIEGAILAAYRAWCEAEPAPVA